MKELVIQHGIEVPAPARIYYPFLKMKVGDSFWVQDERGLRNAADNHRRKYGAVFTVRKVDRGWRCWRIA